MLTVEADLQRQAGCLSDEPTSHDLRLIMLLRRNGAAEPNLDAVAVRPHPGAVHPGRQEAAEHITRLVEQMVLHELVQPCRRSDRALTGHRRTGPNALRWRCGGAATARQGIGRSPC